ncbi:MAG: hypothetical protein ACRDY2_13035 [Acidimicrobiales bacterium]
MGHVGRGARRSVGLALMAALAAATLLTGCQQGGGGGDARAACNYVSSSIGLFDRSQHESSAAAAADKAAALTQLRLALAKAALAASKDTAWDALVTTLSESNDRVPESSLIPALTQQCAQFHQGP